MANTQPIIAQLSFSTAAGGLEMSTVTWTELFKAHGFESHCICFKQSFLESELQRRGLKNAAFTPRDYFAPKEVKKLKNYIKNTGITHIFVHSLKDLFHTYWIKKSFPHIKITAISRMYITSHNKKDWLHKKIFSQLEQLIALTENHKEALLKVLPLDADKIKVIPNGVNTKIFKPFDAQDFRMKHNIRGQTKLIALIGRLDFQKGHSEFVQAASQVLKSHPHTQFLIVGDETHNESGYKTQLLEDIHNRGIQDHIQLIGFQNNMPEVMNALDILAMPSYHEAFGKVLIEAMACKVPVVTVDAASPPEIVDHGKCGLIAKVESGESLAEKLLEYLDNPQLMQDMAQKGYERVQSHYAAEIVNQQILDLVT